MKQLWKKSLLLGVVAAGAAGCGEPVKPTPTPTPETLEVTEDIKGDTTWKSGNTYTLTRHIFVESGTLTIEPGTKVVGNQGSSLVVTRGAKLNAVGTKEQPILFTSAKEAGTRKAGDWGGVVLLGRAKLNVPEQSIEGFVSGSDSRTLYGGTDDAHDCGKLKYARIEFAGFRLLNNNELNGLTLGGCGSATEVDYVQVHRGTDDGVEMFGGTANLKHIVVTLADDDGLDWDFGYRGKVQFLVVQQGAELGNNGIEADNYERGNDNEPRSAPEVWNATFIGRAKGGTEKSIAMTLRRGTAGTLNNLIITGFTDGGVDVVGSSSVTQYNQGNLALKNTLFWDLKGDKATVPFMPNPTLNTDGTVANPDSSNFNEQTELLKSANNNRVEDPKLNAAYTDVKAPNFLPQAGSPALNPDNAATPPTAGFFDTSAKYLGALGTQNWLEGWTAYPEN